MPGPDIGTLQPFYEGVFGWTVEAMGPSYSQVQTPGVDGALVEAPDASLTVGVVVPDPAGNRVTLIQA